MKKFVALFTASFQELRQVRTVTVMAMFAAIAVVLGMFSVEIGPYIRIGFSSIPNGLVSYLFGPVAGSLFAGTLDIIKYVIKPSGAFFPPMTLVTMLAGLIYGCMYYKKSITLPRVLAAKFLVMLICNVILNTLCLSMLYGKGFFVLLPARALKNLIMWPVDSLVFYTVAKALERIGVFRFLHFSRGQQI
ncbi:MAG: folate family ECF transporter S component [Roseburia sp.]|jgi:ECF transporter S component (folate family)|nr:folate family ECF transporter S component [Roseburia sp.]